MEEKNTQNPSEENKPLSELWQKKKMAFWFCLLILGGIIYLCFTCTSLYKDKNSENYYWEKNLKDSALEGKDADYIADISKDATEVSVGTYVESLKEINMKNSNYRIVMKVWFKWNGNEDLDMMHNFHVYNGVINKLEEVRSYTENGVTYQLANLDVTVFKNYWTKRFPLESHQLRFYIEPDYTIDKVKLVADQEYSDVNSSLSIAGYKFVRFANGTHTMEYSTTYGDDRYSKAAVTSEYMGQIELNRDGFGLYVKCFIALFGTSLWVFVTMFLCSYHHIDPLSMIPAALFGTVSNIMVGANLLPDALEIGLLEYINVWGIFTILASALVIINVNRIRTKYKDMAFASFFGRVMFYSLLILVISGHILMPVLAYMR